MATDAAARYAELPGLASLDILRRPLTEKEARVLGAGTDEARRKAMASLMHLLENDDELAAEMEKALVCGLIHKAMSARLLDARKGPIAELMSDIGKAVESYNGMLR